MCRDRLGLRGLSFGVLSLLLAPVPGMAQQPQAHVLPSLPHIIPGACQLECCRLGQWSTSFSRVAIYRNPGDQDPSPDTIPVRTSFTADSTVVVVRQFGIAVTDEPVPQRYNDSPALARGDTVYLLRYEGDDRFAAIVGGQRRPVDAFWAGRPGMSRPATWRTYGHVVQDLSTEWWVRIRLGVGPAGWINMTHVSSVRGPDACSQ